MKLNLVMDLAECRSLGKYGTVSYCNQGRIGRGSCIGSSINGDARLRCKGSGAGRICFRLGYSSYRHASLGADWRRLHRDVNLAWIVGFLGFLIVFCFVLILFSRGFAFIIRSKCSESR